MKPLKKLIISSACLLSISAYAYADAYRVVELGGGSPSDVPWVRLITNQYDWETLVRESYGADGIDPVVFCNDVPVSTDCVEPPPVVDFETEQVIAGGLGLQADSGHRLVVSSVMASRPSGYQYVYVADIVAGAGCVTLPVVINPMLTIVVEKMNLPVKLTFFTTTTTCDLNSIDLQ